MIGSSPALAQRLAAADAPVALGPAQQTAAGLSACPSTLRRLLAAKEGRQLRALVVVMQKAGGSGDGFFDEWMKHQSDLVQVGGAAGVGWGGGGGGGAGGCVVGQQPVMAAVAGKRGGWAPGGRSPGRAGGEHGRGVWVGMERVTGGGLAVEAG